MHQSEKCLFRPIHMFPEQSPFGSRVSGMEHRPKAMRTKAGRHYLSIIFSSTYVPCFSIFSSYGFLVLVSQDGTDGYQSHQDYKGMDGMSAIYLKAGLRVSMTIEISSECRRMIFGWLVIRRIFLLSHLQQTTKLLETFFVETGFFTSLFLKNGPSVHLHWKLRHLCMLFLFQKFLTLYCWKRILIFAIESSPTLQIFAFN